MYNDIVYIVGRESRWDDMELKYSLRSVEKHCINWSGRVFIIGHKPRFIHNVIHIPASDAHKNKARNIMEKVLIAASSDDVSENFMLLNDDYFLRKPVDVTNYPYWHKCDLARTMDINKTEYYFHVKATFDMLKYLERPILNFDTHCPIIYNKEKFRDLVKNFNWDIPHGYILRSMYCNIYGLNDGYKEDCKVSRPLGPQYWDEYTKNADCFSIGDSAITGGFMKFMEQEYPEKSRFEV